ncbi:caspase family protein [Methylobacterium iners]|uniref:Photosystem I assembly protein Ycf3 n=1 Tax=Methylobacterium iners TaxID=418707 RepID=A0ABQ4RZP1_9HYPH|nr:caspase family protein [Methylobacterium iners]GJD95674.1 Photosystem I assembly protein Ycf3 [Methylobacterium iners]
MRPPRSVATTMRLIAVAAFLLSAVWGAPGPAAAAAARHALVIANAAYPDSDAVLPTPLASARTLGEALKSKGFAVEAAENLGKEAMQAAVDRFVAKVEPGSIALVFFSGYGIQVARKNYLVPVDARIWSEADVTRDGISVEGIMSGLEKRGASARALVLDASRRNPFERRFRSFSMGLAAPGAAPGSISLYAAAVGGVINEPAGATQSPFVTELVKQIGQSELNAEQVFTATRDALTRDSRNLQNPAFASGLEDPFFFDPTRVKPVAKAEPKPLPSPQPAPEKKPAVEKPPEPVVAAKEPDAPAKAEEAAARAFDRADAIGSKASYEEFLRSHPAGPLAERARAEIRRLDAALPKPEPVPAAVAPPAGKSYSTAELSRKTALDDRIARNALDEAAFYERGQFHAQRDEYTQAIADFDESIRLNPINPEAYNNRCWMRAMLNETERAMADCNEALRLRPNFLDALDSRGLVHLKTGAHRAALADYDAALKVDPNHPSALYGRGVARLRLGQTKQADRDFAGALALNPTIDKDFAQYGLR